MSITDLQPSAHLTWDELKCHDGTPYPIEFRKDGRIYKLAAIFENIRSLCGNKPIKIHSAYRTPTWNKKIGGVSHSQHVDGRALDLGIPQGLTIEQFHKLILSHAFNWGIRGIGHYPTFVHIDIRPGNRLVIWNGTQNKTIQQ